MTAVELIDARVLKELQGCRKKAFVKAKNYILKAFGTVAESQLDLLVFNPSRRLSNKSLAVMCEESMDHALVRLLATKTCSYEISYRERMGQSESWGSDKNEWLEDELQKAVKSASAHCHAVREEAKVPELAVSEGTSRALSPPKNTEGTLEFFDADVRRDSISSREPQNGASSTGKGVDDGRQEAPTAQSTKTTSTAKPKPYKPQPKPKPPK